MNPRNVYERKAVELLTGSHAYDLIQMNDGRWSVSPLGEGIRWYIWELYEENPEKLDIVRLHEELREDFGDELDSGPTGDAGQVRAYYMSMLKILASLRIRIEDGEGAYEELQ